MGILTRNFLSTYILFLLMPLGLKASNPTIIEKSITTCDLPKSLISEIQSYQTIVNKIIDDIVNGKFKGDTYNSLAKFTDKFGPRISGSKALEDSIDYLLNEFRNANLDRVYTEKATVPHWERGEELAYLYAPRTVKIPILGLGTTVGTPKQGLTAGVVVVESFEELKSLPPENVYGNIVVFVPQWKSYGETVKYRSQGASEASKMGAVAALVRSVTPFSIASPHTGSQNYQEGVRKIPVACITVEDAEMLLRMYRNGDPIQIFLQMGAKNLEPKVSRNTIGELLGTVHKNRSVVIVSGHLDSWDVGVGAMDDGGGAFISWHALKYLKALNLQPKRTIRAIMWTCEEFGYYGSKQYEKDHKANEEDEFNFFIESDIGTFQPLGMDFSGNPEAECIFREVLSLMTPLNTTAFKTPMDGGPDISVWTNRGFPGASLLNKNDKYFWFHHTEGDTMAVENPDSLDRCTALFAAISYVLADLSVDMPKVISA